MKVCLSLSLRNVRSRLLFVSLVTNRLLRLAGQPGPRHRPCYHRLFIVSLSWHPPFIYPSSTIFFFDLVSSFPPTFPPLRTVSFAVSHRRGLPRLRSLASRWSPRFWVMYMWVKPSQTLMLHYWRLKNTFESSESDVLTQTYTTRSLRMCSSPLSQMLNSTPPPWLRTQSAHSPKYTKTWAYPRKRSMYSKTLSEFFPIGPCSYAPQAESRNWLFSCWAFESGMFWVQTRYNIRTSDTGL